ncbi:hypothetical protein [Leptotrichia massiliensis]|jgi:hypothetical protein|uniref:hypothetical protein n=1 Tax=Leptotrichia massiliensis TaxID=1852388 RepID=UPI0028D43EB6|nr:hypothetical protein [Leptotrichia massiliensis]
MKKFIKVSAILGLVIITIAAIKYQSGKLEKKKGNNQEIQEKQQQEILDICRTNKVMKIYSENDGENFYVVLENKNIYKIDEDKLGNYTIGEYCK